MSDGENSGPAVFGPATRALAALAALLFAVLAVTLFVAPSWSADRFAWKVSDFVTMTIGGWSLGTAVFAAMVAAAPRIARSYACLVYLAAFGLLELGSSCGIGICSTPSRCSRGSTSPRWTSRCSPLGPFSRPTAA